MQKYYKMETLTLGPYPMINGPSDVDGNTVGVGSPLLVQGVLGCELFHPKFKEIPDNICNMDSLLTLTYRAKEIFAKFRLPRGTSFHETEVYRKRRWKGDLLFKCYVVYFSQIFKLLDLDKCEKIPAGRHPAMIEVTKPVFPYEAIKDFDLFTNLYTKFICSEHLKAEIEDNQLTNFKFTEVEVY